MNDHAVLVDPRTRADRADHRLTPQRLKGTKHDESHYDCGHCRAWLWLSRSRRSPLSRVTAARSPPALSAVSPSARSSARSSIAAITAARATIKRGYQPVYSDCRYRAASRLKTITAASICDAFASAIDVRARVNLKRASGLGPKLQPRTARSGVFCAQLCAGKIRQCVTIAQQVSRRRTLLRFRRREWSCSEMWRA